MTRAIFFSYYFYADSFNAVITQNRHHPVYENKGNFWYPSDEVLGWGRLSVFRDTKVIKFVTRTRVYHLRYVFTS